MWKAALKTFELVWSFRTEHVASNFLKAVYHKFCFVHFWILRLGSFSKSFFPWKTILDFRFLVSKKISSKYSRSAVFAVCIYSNLSVIFVILTRKTLNISPGPIQNHKHFLTGLYTGGLYAEPLLCLDLYLKKEEWNKTRKQYSCSKMSFYCLTANKTRDVYHNSGPLASLRLKNTWGGALISVDILKITLLHIFFLYFYEGLIYGTTFVLVFW